MTGVSTDLGSAYAIDAFTAKLITDGAKLILVKSNTTQATTLTMASITEADFTGYSAQTLGSFAAATVSAHVATAVGTPQTFTITSGTQSIYGWAIVNSAKTVLYHYTRDTAAPISMDAAGLNTYTPTPTIAGKDDSV